MTRRTCPTYFAALVLALLAFPGDAAAQFGNQTGNVVGTIGGACNSTVNDYGWPNTNGAILKCVSNVWTLVTTPATAAGSTGYVQFNSSNALAGDSNLFWDNTNKRLGIGTTSPNALLTVGSTDSFTVDNSGDVGASGTVIANFFEANNSGYSFYNWSTTRLSSGTGGILQLIANGIAGLTVGTTGLVGIGTASPLSKLDIYGGVAIGTGYAGITAAPTNGAIIQGSVGIGVTNPASYSLNVAGTTDLNGAVTAGSSISIGNGSAAGPTYTFWAGNQEGMWRPGTGALAFSTGGSERVRITNTGIGIGTTTPNGSAALDVFSTTAGLLPPRVTAMQETAIGTNAAMSGMLVYNTTLAELDVYNAATPGWEAVGANAADAAGSTGWVQFNNNGDLDASANFFWDNTHGRLGIVANSPAAALHIAGNQSAAGWGTGGIGIRQDAATYTDTSSSGTVGGTTYVDAIGIPTIAASNTVSYNNLATFAINGAPVAGTNVTLSDPIALYVNGNSWFPGLTRFGNTAGVAPAAQVQISGAVSSAAWGSSGIGLRIDNGTYTDTTSSGTVSTNTVHHIAGPTLAASSATTYTSAYTLGIGGPPAAGANVTITNAYALSVTGTSVLGGEVYVGASGSYPAWTSGGIILRENNNTYTDTTSSGTVGQNYANRIGMPTFAASSATTYTTAATFEIDNAPAAGTNVTLTNPLALFVGGNSNLGGFTSFGGATGSPASSMITIQPSGNALSAASWTSTGLMFASDSATLTDTTGSGTIGTRTANTFGAPTFAASSAETITNAATLYVGNAPTAGTNVTITNPLALEVAFGNSYFGGKIGIGTMPNGLLTVGENVSAAAWGAAGIAINEVNATYTDTSSSGTVGQNYVNRIGQPTLAASSAATYTTAATFEIDNAPAAGTNVTLTNPLALLVGGNSNLGGMTSFGGASGTPATSVVTILPSGTALSAASWLTTGLMFASNPATLTDTTGSGAIAGTRVANSFGAPTFAASSTETVANAATLYVQGAPTAGINTTITNALALEVAAGTSYFGGNVGIGTTAPTGALQIGQPSAFNIVFSTANDQEATFGWNGATRAIISTNAYQTFGSSYDVISGDAGIKLGSGVNYSYIIGSGTNLLLNPVAGNVGIGTSSPQATLDVNGYARLKLNSSQPVACGSTNQGAVALNHLAQMCACNGSSWIFADSVGATCSW